jgi:hypothetical protein
MIRLMKLFVGFRLNAFPELIFVHHLLLLFALARVRATMPQHAAPIPVTLSADEQHRAAKRAGAEQHRDVKDDQGVQLAGAGKPFAADLKMAQALAVTVRDMPTWFEERGWPSHLMDTAWIRQFQESGRLQWRRFDRGQGPTGDFSSVACSTTRVTDSKYVYVHFAADDGPGWRCVARIEYFVSLQPAAGNVMRFAGMGQREAQPLKLAVCTMWNCEGLKSRGCCADFGQLGRLPDMIAVRNLEENAAAVRKGTRFKPYLVSLTAMSAPLVSVNLELLHGMDRADWPDGIWLTANQATGTGGSVQEG